MLRQTDLRSHRRLSHLLKALVLLVVAHLLAGCELTRIFIIADPDLASLALSETLEITAVVTGTNNRADKAVEWMVCDGNGQNCVSGGNSARGTISPTSPDSSGNSVALYSAPSSQPAPPDCTQETDGCSVVVKGQMVNFDAACFTRVKILEAANPVPAIGTIRPDTVTAGGADFTLTVDGTGFIASSVVQIDGSDRTTTFVDSTTLEATVLAVDIATAGTASVTVFNPTPGGGTSNSAVLSINNPTPAITTLTPSSATEGDPAFTLTVDGSGFVAGSVVRWDGSDRTTTFVSDTQLEASIPDTDIATAGTASIIVFNPTPGGGVSNSLSFTITAAGNPVPAIESLAPDTVTVGGVDFTLTANGSGFISGSVVRFNGNDRATTFLSNAQLQTTVTSADIATAGTANVTVFNPTPGGGESNIAVLNINNPAPTITTITPNSATEGGPAFTLAVDGSGFISASVVRWAGSDRTTTFISDTQLTASIPDTDIATAGTASVTVFNPTPGGGTSNALTFTIAPSGPVACTPGVGTRFSVASDGIEGNDDSDRPVVSATGRYVAFNSLATNLVPNDTNATTDIFVHDRDTDNDGIFDEPGAISTVRVSVASDGSQADGSSIAPSISRDGRFVAFQSGATNLVANDTNALSDAFVHDRDADNDGNFDEPGAIATVRVSVASDGSQANDQSRTAVVSSDGRFTIFISPATNLVAADTNGSWDVFLHDRDLDDDGIFDEAGAIATVRVSVASDGTEASSTPFLPGPAMSSDGRFVAFHSTSTNLVPGGITAQSVFVHDRDVDQDGNFDEAGQISTILVSVASDGTQGNNPSTDPAITPDGRFIAFVSLATNFIANDTNGRSDIFVHDRDADEDGIFDEAGAIATVIMSVASDGTQGDNGSIEPVISDDGRFVAFRSNATNLVAGDTSTNQDIFVHDRDTDEDGIFDEPGAIDTVRVSVAQDGTEGNLAGRSPAISADGSAVVFSSDSDNLVLNDNNVARDIFGGEACLVMP